MKHYNKYKSIEDLSRPSTPHNTSMVDDRYIICTAEINTCVLLGELHVDIGNNVCEYLKMESCQLTFTNKEACD